MSACGTSRWRRSRCCWVLVSSGLLFACRMEPDFARPDVESLIGAEFVQEQDLGARANSDTEQGAASLAELDATRWWERWEDETIDTWIDAALAHNLDLQVAAARVLEAEALVRSANGARWPALDASLTVGRSEVLVEPRGRFYSTQIAPQLGGAWRADLFGRLASAERGARASATATRLDRDSLAQVIVAAVIRQRVALSVVQRRSKLAEEIVSSRARTLEVVDRRYQSGVASTSAVDLRLARENLAAARATLPALQQETELQRHALDVLLGRKPNAQVAVEAEFPALPNLPPPPAAVPARLLDRRPDLLAAEFRALAANAGVGVALADLFPDLLLNGGVGWNSEELSRLFSPDKLFASLVGDLAVRLFDGGRRRAEVDAARARLQAQASQYAAQVLDAVREVEDALVRERRLDEQLRAVGVQVEEARAAETLAHDRYRQGLENLLTVLETERRRSNAEDFLLQLQGARWFARIDLHLALGGDWFAGSEHSPRTSP